MSSLLYNSFHDFWLIQSWQLLLLEKQSNQSDLSNKKMEEQKEAKVWLRQHFYRNDVCSFRFPLSQFLARAQSVLFSTSKETTQCFLLLATEKKRDIFYSGLKFSLIKISHSVKFKIFLLDSGTVLLSCENIEQNSNSKIFWAKR